MQIPNQIPAFENKTCLVVMDHEQARVFFINDQTMEEKETITSDYPSRDDMERTSMVTPSGGHSAEESEKMKQISLKKLVAKINNFLLHAFQEKQFEDLIFTVPSNAIHALKESLPTVLQKQTPRFIPKILTKNSLTDILEHLQNS